MLHQSVVRMLKKRERSAHSSGRILDQHLTPVLTDPTAMESQTLGADCRRRYNPRLGQSAQWLTSSNASCIDSCEPVKSIPPLVNHQDRRLSDAEFLLRVKSRTRKLRGSLDLSVCGQLKRSKRISSLSSSVVSEASGTERFKASANRDRRRLTTVKHVRDLINFAVDTGRLTESCARVLSGLLLELETKSTTPGSLCAIVSCPNAEVMTSTAPSTPQDYMGELDEPGTLPDPLFAAIDQNECRNHKPLLGAIDDDAVSREVRFRKEYLEDGVKGLVGITPLDPPPHIVDPRTARQNKRQLGALSLIDPEINYLPRDLNRPGALEDLLSRYESLLGTPASHVQKAVRRKAFLVRQLSYAFCAGQSTMATYSMTKQNIPAADVAETDPRLNATRRRESSELYKRLVRALDQRAPPEQRLLGEHKIDQSKSQSKRIPMNEQSLPLWARKGPDYFGSRIFGSDTRLSEFDSLEN